MPCSSQSKSAGGQKLEKSQLVVLRQIPRHFALLEALTVWRCITFTSVLSQIPSKQSSNGMTLMCGMSTAAIFAGASVVVTGDEETNQFVGNAVVTDDEETNQFVGNAVVNALPAGSPGTAAAISATVVTPVSAVVESPCLNEHPATLRRSMQTCCSWASPAPSFASQAAHSTGRSSSMQQSASARTSSHSGVGPQKGSGASAQAWLSSGQAALQTSIGSIVGAIVVVSSTSSGNAVCKDVGADVGEADGGAVGNAVGNAVGENVGEAVCKAAGEAGGEASSGLGPALSVAWDGKVPLQTRKPSEGHAESQQKSASSSRIVQSRMLKAEQFLCASANVAAIGKHCEALSMLSHDTCPPTSLQHRTAAAAPSSVDPVPMRSAEQTLPVRCSPTPGLSVGKISTDEEVVG